MLQQILHDIQQMDGAELFSGKESGEAQHKRKISGNIRQDHSLVLKAIPVLQHAQAKGAVCTDVRRRYLVFKRKIVDHECQTPPDSFQYPDRRDRPALKRFLSWGCAFHSQYFGIPGE